MSGPFAVLNKRLLHQTLSKQILPADYMLTLCRQAAEP